MNEQDNSRYQEYLKSEKWQRIAYKRMQIDNFECQGCGCRGTSQNELEVHHLRYRDVLYHEDECDYIYTQLVTLCRSCHKNLHHIMERVTSADGRRGWLSDSRVPDVHVFNLTGRDDEYYMRIDNKDGKEEYKKT